MRKRIRFVWLLCLFILLCLLMSSVLISGCGDENDKSRTDGMEDETGQTAPDEGAVTTPDDDKDDIEDKADDDTSDDTDTDSDKNDSSSSTPVSSDDEEDIIEAALEGARSNNPDLPELEVLSVKVAGDWARVVLEAEDGSTDAATALLKKEGDRWVVFDFGTGIGPEMHPEAPAELFE